MRRRWAGLGTLWPCAAASASVPAPGADAATALQALLGLVAVLGLVLALAWGLRQLLRLRPAVADGQLAVLGGVSMGPRERVVLLQVGETQLLVGVAPGHLRTLHVLERPLPVPPRPAPASFARQLGRLLQPRVPGNAGD